jgi:cyanophycin synthetase
MKTCAWPIDRRHRQRRRGARHPVPPPDRRQLVSSAGARKQRRIQAAEMDTTSAIAESIAQDKELTKKLLHAAGVPVPIGRVVVDADDAWAAAWKSACPWWSNPRTATRARA